MFKSIRFLIFIIKVCVKGPMKVIGIIGAIALLLVSVFDYIVKFNGIKLKKQESQLDNMALYIKKEVDQEREELKRG